MGTLNEILDLMHRMDKCSGKSASLNEEYDADKDRAEGFALRLRAMKLYRCLLNEPNKDEIIKNLRSYKGTYPSNPTDMFFNHLEKINGKDYFSITVDGKRNYFCADGTLLSNIWVDAYFGFLDGIFIVKKNGKYNYMRSDGTLIWNKTDTDEWFDSVAGYVDCPNVFYVNIHNPYKTNYLKIDGDLVWNKPFDQWFDVMIFENELEEDDEKLIFSAYNRGDKFDYMLDINGNIIGKKKLNNQ